MGLGDAGVYSVLINHEEQYSIFPADRQPSLGWTDMTPLSFPQRAERMLRDEGAK